MEFGLFLTGYLPGPAAHDTDLEHTMFLREVEYTEPAVRGDTSGKVMKPARLKGSGFELPVAAFIEIGDKIEIDTTGKEYLFTALAKVSALRTRRADRSATA